MVCGVVWCGVVGEREEEGGGGEGEGEGEGWCVCGR